MKKLISVLLLLSVVAISFVGCFFDSLLNKDYFVSKLEKNDFIQISASLTEDELAEIENELNKDFRFNSSEPFTFDLTGYAEMLKMGESEYECKIYEFVDSAQAEMYVKHCVSARNQLDKSKAAHVGRVVIVTDSQTVMDILNIEFN